MIANRIRTWCLLITCVLGAQLGSASARAGVVRVVVYEGAITPVSAEYLVGAIEGAETDGVEALVIEIDTPGGLDAAMREIVKAELTATVPVVVYVAPPGSRAASAGVFLTMAAHVAAMAPGTNLGSASPVQMMGASMDSTMARKVTNDAVAYLEGIARQRGRNVEWASRFVADSENIPAERALEERVIDLVAANRLELLEELHGRTVELPTGQRVLETQGAEIVEVRMGIRHRILKVIADPTLAYLLLLLGIYGIFFELSNPGAILPGVVGAIAIVLALFALSTLPVNLAGIGLIVLSVVFFVLEVFVTSYGLLGLAGVASLVLGSTMLFQSEAEWARLSWTVILPTVLVSAGFLTLCVVLAVRGQRRPKAMGKETMVGEQGRVTVAIDGPGAEGKVVVHGEVWPAVAREELDRNARVRVTAVRDRVLEVERL